MILLSAKNPVVRAFASVKITMACLALLFVLTLWGTVAQVDQGLYLAQERYFFSWYFLAGGIVPFPGAQLVMWILFINLVCASITRFVLKWSYTGIWITHVGLLLYFAAAYVTFQLTEESNLSLIPGETKNVSSAYHNWELSFWRESESGKKSVTAVSEGALRPGKTVTLPEGNISVLVKTYFRNASAYTAAPEEQIMKALNPSGIRLLEPKPFDIEPERNIPGGVFTVSAGGQNTDVLLYGAEGRPAEIAAGDQTLSVQLRRRRSPLPLLLTLNKFEKEFYPNTDTPKSFHSYLTVDHDGVKRDVEVYMNNPFRFKDYTFYQASYGVDEAGREFSTFAVVKNKRRLLPYIASGVTFLGLTVHFMMMAFARRKS